jgi:FMN phosphatase YigB (HAD superfamily)
MLYSDLLAKISEAIKARLKAQSESEGNPNLTSDASVTTSSGVASAPAAPSTSAQAGETSSPSNPHIAFGKSVQNWSIFPDSSVALHELAKDYKLVVLSNVDNDSFRYTHAKLSLGRPAANADELAIYTRPNSPSTTSASSTADENTQPFYANYWHPQQTPNSCSPFSLVVTAQDVKCYKPALGGFHTVLECVRTDPALLGDLGLSEEEAKTKVLTVAQSLVHDHEPAHQLGLNGVWIDRQIAVTCREPPQGIQRWTWRFGTLGEMAEAVAKEKAA